MGIEFLLVTPDRSLVFPSVEYVRNMVSKVGMKQGSSSVPVVLDARHVYGADFTAAKVSALGLGLAQCGAASLALRFQYSGIPTHVPPPQGVKSLTEDFSKRKQPLLFYNLRPSVVEVFQGVRPGDLRYCRSESELNELLRTMCSVRAREQV